MNASNHTHVQLFVGIDVAKGFHVACALDQAGKVRLKPFRFLNTAEGIASLHARLGRRGEPEACLVGMEATGHYWIALARALDKHGYSVVVFNPLSTRRRADADLRRTHDDPVDARRIARMLRSDPPPIARRSQPPYLGLRLLGRLHFALVNAEHRVKQRLRTYIDRGFPEFEKVFPNCFSATARAILGRWPTPADLLGAARKTVLRVTLRASRCRIGAERLKQLRAAARSSIGDDRDPEAIRLAITTLLGTLGDIESRRKTIDEELVAQARTLDSPLDTVPGISPLLAAIILGETGDITTFNEPKSLVAYAGLDPCRFRSGKFEARSTPISKRGSPYLRRALYLAASTARLHDPQLGTLYSELRASGRTHRDATCYIAAKIARILWRLCKDRRPFQSQWRPH